MPHWVKEVCQDAFYGNALGVTRGVFGITLFTIEAMKEITNLKKLAVSVTEKSPKLSVNINSITCESIKKGKTLGIEESAKNAPPKVVSPGVVIAIQLVCRKAFK